MSLTDNRVYEAVGASTRLPGVAKDDAEYFRGALLVTGTDGKLTIPSDGANLIPAGYYTGHGMSEPYHSLVVPSGQAPVIERIVAYLWIPFAGAALADVGKIFYLADDSTVTKTAGTKTWGVLCEGYKDGYVLLNFNNPIPV